MFHPKRWLLLAGLAMVFWPTVTLAAEAKLNTPSILPGDGLRYQVKWWGRDVRGLFVFRPESRALYQAGRAQERLAEANTLIAQNKPALAKQALTNFKQESDHAEARLESIPADRAKQPRAASIIQQVGLDSSTNLAVIQNMDIDLQDSSDTDLKKTLKDDAMPSSQAILDTSSDLKGDPPMPAELLDQLQTFSKLGVIDQTKIDDLTSATRRQELRQKMEGLAASGDIPADLVVKFDTAKINDQFKESAEKYQAYTSLQSFKAITLASTVSPPDSAQLERLNAFKASYKAGDSIPTDLRKFILPNLFGAQLAKDLALNSANIDPSVFHSSLDQKFFTQFKNQFQLSNGNQFQTQNNKFVIPQTFDLATSFSQFTPFFSAMQQQMQAHVAEAIASFKQTSTNSQFQNSSDFQAQFASQLGFDPNDQRFVPAGFKPDEFKGGFQFSVRPEAFGLPPLPKGPNGEPDQAELNKLIADGKFTPPANPPAGFGLENFVKQFGNRSPEDAAKLFTPQPPDQFFKQFQATGAPPPQAFQNQPGQSGQPPAFFGPTNFMPTNFRPSDDALKAFTQNQGKFDALRSQFQQQEQNRQQLQAPPFNELRDNGQLKQFEQQNQPGPNGRNPNEPFRQPGTGNQNPNPNPGGSSPPPQNQPTDQLRREPTQGSQPSGNSQTPPPNTSGGSQPPPMPQQSSQPQFQPPPNEQPPPSGSQPPPPPQSGPTGFLSHGYRVAVSIITHLIGTTMAKGDL